MALFVLQVLYVSTSLGILTAASNHYSYKYVLNAKNLEGIVKQTAGDNTIIDALDPERSPSGELRATQEHIQIKISTTEYRKRYFKAHGYDVENDAIEYPAEFSTITSNSSTNGSLPNDIKLEIVHTTAIIIDNYMVLRLSDDLDELRKKTAIQFYVMLANTTSAAIVSNPLPFMVHIIPRDKQFTEHGAAIYAGIIVLIIVCIALLVPFSVRAKRRRRAGKPICGFGSATSTDIQKQTLAGKDNASMIFDDGKEFSRRSSVATDAGHESLQQHMVRSVSDFHFQPKWLDPHYNDVHLPPPSKQNNNTNKTSNGLHPNSRSIQERL